MMIVYQSGQIVTALPPIDTFERIVGSRISALDGPYCGLAIAQARIFANSEDIANVDRGYCRLDHVKQTTCERRCFECNIIKSESELCDPTYVAMILQGIHDVDMSARPLACALVA